MGRDDPGACGRRHCSTATGSPRPSARAHNSSRAGAPAQQPAVHIDVGAARCRARVGDIETGFSTTSTTCRRSCRRTCSRRAAEVEHAESIVRGKSPSSWRGAVARRGPPRVALSSDSRPFRRAELQSLEGNAGALPHGCARACRRDHRDCGKAAARTHRAAQGAARRGNAGGLHGAVNRLFKLHDPVGSEESSVFVRIGLCGAARPMTSPVKG